MSSTPSGSELIGIWAYSLWADLGEPDCLNPLTISGYALQPNVLGLLNLRLQTCFRASGATGNGSVNYTVVPELGAAELALIDSMYRISYYNNVAMSTMGQGGDSIPWVALKEGDSSIARASPVNIGKEYREMAKDERANLSYNINAYINTVQEAGTPRAVNYLNPPSYLANYYGGGAGVYYNGPGVP